MLFRVRIKAGVLLYALLMAAVFSLFLQVYLDSLAAAHRQGQAQLQRATAQLMAEQTRQGELEEAGVVSYQQGQVTYHQSGDFLQMTITLTDGSQYQEEFFQPRKQPELPPSAETDRPEKEKQPLKDAQSSEEDTSSQDQPNSGDQPQEVADEAEDEQVSEADDELPSENEGDSSVLDLEEELEEDADQESDDDFDDEAVEK